MRKNNSTTVTMSKHKNSPLKSFIKTDMTIKKPSKISCESFSLGFRNPKGRSPTVQKFPGYREVVSTKNREILTTKNGSTTFELAPRRSVESQDLLKETVRDIGIDIEENIGKIFLKPSKPKKELASRTEGTLKARPHTHNFGKSDTKTSKCKNNLESSEALEAEVRKNILGKRDVPLETFSKFFEKIIQANTTFGTSLKLIKRGYETNFARMNSALLKNVDIYSNKYAGVKKELDRMKGEKERLQHQNKALLSELNKKNEVLKSLQGFVSDSSKRGTKKSLRRQGATGSVDSRGVVIPKLDLSKIERKFDDEKIVIIHPQTNSKFLLTPKLVDPEKVSISDAKLSKHSPEQFPKVKSDFCYAKKIVINDEFIYF